MMVSFSARVLALAGLFSLALLPIVARADTATSKVGVGLSVSSLGAGVSVAVPLDAASVIRVQTGSFSTSPTIKVNGDSYSGPFTLNNALVDGEFHSGGRPFYLAAGVLIDDNSIRTSTSSAGVTIGNTTYGAGTASATITWNHFAPYLGVGTAPVKGSGFGADLGAAFIGSATVGVTTTIGGVSASDIANAQQQIATVVNKYQIYPVLGVRYTWGF
jgi:hypothetical protein